MTSRADIPGAATGQRTTDMPIGTCPSVRFRTMAADVSGQCPQVVRPVVRSAIGGGTTGAAASTRLGDKIIPSGWLPPAIRNRAAEMQRHER